MPWLDEALETYLPPVERRAERAALGGMLAFRLEEERMLVPDIAAAVRPESFVDFGDLGGRRDRIADDSSADAAHDLGDGAIAVDYTWNARVSYGHFRSLKQRRALARRSASSSCRPQRLLDGVRTGSRVQRPAFGPGPRTCAALVRGDA